MKRTSITLAAMAAHRRARRRSPPRRRTRPPPRRAGRRAGGGQGALSQGLFRLPAEGAPRAGPARHARAAQRDSRGAQHPRAARARGEEEGPRQERRRQEPDRPRVADRSGPRLRRRLGQGEPDPGRRAAQGIRHDQVADGRQGVQGPPHPRGKGRRGEGNHRRAAEGRQVREARRALEGLRAPRPTAATSTGMRRAISSSRSPTRWSSCRRASSPRSPCRRSSAGT